MPIQIDLMSINIELLNIAFYADSIKFMSIHFAATFFGLLLDLFCYKRNLALNLQIGINSVLEATFLKI